MDELEAARFRIYALQDGAVRAQAFAFCLELGLFERLSGSPLTFEAIAAGFALSPRVLPALLAFLCSQDLLERDAAGRFCLTAPAETFLVRSSPRYIGGRGLLFAGFYDTLRQLPESLATGMPWTPQGQRDLFSKMSSAEQEWFADGMFANAVHGGRELAAGVDFTRFRRLLDVGGNAGGYTIAVLQAHPHLQATIFDLEAVLPLAARRVGDAGLGGRVALHSGSFFEDCLPGGQDVLLLSSILHDWADEDCAVILRHCYRALAPGGTVIVTEPMLADDATGPDHPSVSGLTMAVLGGENRTRTRIAAMLEAAGFSGTWLSPLGPQNSIVTARKPAR